MDFDTKKLLKNRLTVLILTTKMSMLLLCQQRYTSDVMHSKNKTATFKFSNTLKLYTNFSKINY